MLSLIGNGLVLKQNSKKQGEIEKNTLTISQLDTENKDKNKALDEKDKQIDKLKNEISKQNGELEKKDKEIKEKNNIISQKDKKIENLGRSTTLTRGVTSGNYNRKAKFLSTFYFPLAADAGSMEHDGDASKTASGRPPGPTVFAVDPTIIPMGSKMRVTYPNGEVRVGVAGDTGGAIKGYKIDTFVWTSQEGNSRGRENVVIEWEG